jgi:hypothetical protein
MGLLIEDYWQKKSLSGFDSVIIICTDRNMFSLIKKTKYNNANNSFIFIIVPS